MRVTRADASNKAERRPAATTPPPTISTGLLAICQAITSDTPGWIGGNVSGEEVGGASGEEEVEGAVDVMARCRWVATAEDGVSFSSLACWLFSERDAPLEWSE